VSVFIDLHCADYVCLPYGHGRPQRGGERAFALLEIETKNEKFIENFKAATQFRSTDLILAMAVYLPV